MLAWVSMLVGQQLLSRCLTFLLNVGVTRAMPIDEYGVTVNLALLDATVLFVSREPLRRIAMRGTSPAHVRSCVNLSWFVSIPVSVVITMVASWFWTAPKYSTCMSLYSFALVIDMLSEPFYLVTLIESRVGRRVAFESFATILRVTATFALVVAPFAMGINAFGWAQLVYAITKLAAFVGDAIMWRSTLALPTFLDNGKAFDADVSGLGGMFAIQTVEKYLLTEGEKIVLVGIGNDLQAQGVYALVQNLGSLVARFLLQPIEEVAAIHFSKVCALPLLHRNSADVHPGRAVCSGLSGNNVSDQIHGPSRIGVCCVWPCIFLRLAPHPIWVHVEPRQQCSECPLAVPCLRVNVGCKRRN